MRLEVCFWRWGTLARCSLTSATIECTRLRLFLVVCRHHSLVNKEDKTHANPLQITGVSYQALHNFTSLFPHNYTRTSNVELFILTKFEFKFRRICQLVRSWRLASSMTRVLKLCTRHRQLVIRCRTSHMLITCQAHAPTWRWIATAPATVFKFDEQGRYWPPCEIVCRAL